MTSLVEELGHEVVAEAATGGSAIDEVARHEPDLVVMDFHMPLMDGLEATSVIKERHPDVQVIAYTSTDDPAIRQAFLDAGVCDHVEKGDIEHLVKTLEKCAETAGVRDR